MAAKVIFDFKFNEGTISDRKKTFGEILIDTRKFDGCLGVEVIEDCKDSAHFVFIESWLSQDHYSAYATWRAGGRGKDEPWCLLCRTSSSHNL